MKELLFLLCFWYSAILMCQNSSSITGKIIDLKTKNPKQGASVYIVEQKIGTTSDSTGFFQFNNIKGGKLTVKVSFIGYSEILKEIVLKENQKLNLVFNLVDSSIHINSFEIVAHKNTYIESTTEPQRIEKISSKAIETAPIRNLPELFDYSSGVSLNNQTGIFSSSTIVTMRGMPSNNQSRTLIILDGIPLNKSDQGSVNWNRIDKRNIETVKIIKGPGPACYGSGAMGGIIEMTSKIPQKKIEGAIEAEYGTYNTKKLSVSLGGKLNLDTTKINQLYWKFNGFGRESDGYIMEVSKFLEASDTFLVPIYLQEYSANSTIGYNFKSNQNLELQIGFFDDIRGNGVKVFEDLGTYSTHQTLNFNGSYSKKGDFSQISFKAYSIREHFIKQYESMSEGEYRLYEANVFRNDLGSLFDYTLTKFKNHEFQTGLSFKRGSVDGSDIYFTSTDIITNQGIMDNYGVYLQDTYRFLKNKMKVNLGIRY